LQGSNAIELGESRLIVVHLRGEAYLMLHDGSHAATEFQKFIDHRTLVANSAWGAPMRCRATLGKLEPLIRIF
jgi:hypothetical protein